MTAAARLAHTAGVSAGTEAEPRGDGDETAVANTDTTGDAVIEHLRDARLPSEDAAMALAEARLRRALFDDEPVAIGRFRLLHKLGAGGMGVVYAAYDPELDRSVALKLVRVPARGRDAAVAEARALARLAHPNVVPVHDVGTEGDHVYIVMELVRGQTLGRWSPGRDRDDVVQAYRQAGRGLAAAHAASLVHRDFKPSNAIVGEDGRVRVVDFGLACEAALPGGDDGVSSPAAGTPRYMAPEQAAGKPVTAAADQYSLCVALGEALARPAADGKPTPLPGWLTDVIERGRSPEPGDRFPSMHELLLALDRDPSRRRRRQVAIGVIALLGVGAFAAGRSSFHEREEACSSGPAELAATWAPERRAAALGRIAGLGPYGASLAPLLERQLDEHVAGWLGQHRDACLAHRRGTQSAALLDRRMACLARDRGAVAAVADIVERSDAAALPEAALAVRALPDPRACGDVDALLAAVAPPPPAMRDDVQRVGAVVARARVQVAAGRFADARTTASTAVTEARTLGHAPLLAQALLALGHAAMNMRDRRTAVAPLEEATNLGLASGDDALAVEAWARRAWVQGVSGDGPAAALAGLAVVDGLARRTPAATFARALLHNNVGSIEEVGGDHARARAAFELALEETRAVDDSRRVELLVVRTNLAMLTADAVDRDALFTEAIADLGRLVGTEHPQVLAQRVAQAMWTVDLTTALERLSPACADYESFHPNQDSPTMPLAACWTEVGYLAAEVGRMDRAIDAMTRAVRVRALQPGEAIEAEGYLALWTGDVDTAIDRFATFVDGRDPRDGAWWQQFLLTKATLGLARARRAAGHHADARILLGDVVASLEGLSRGQPFVERRLARARAELAGQFTAGSVNASP